MKTDINFINMHKNEVSEAYTSIRENFSLVDVDDFQCIIKVSGSDSLEFLNFNLPGKLFYLQPFNALTTIILDENQKIIDIVQVLNMEDHYLIICSQIAKHYVLKHLALEQFNVHLQDLSDIKSIVGLEGPYAWKRLKELFSDDIIGLRLYSMMEIPQIQNDIDGIILRSGYAGEYGYRLIIDKIKKDKLLFTLNKQSNIPVVNHTDIALVSHEVRAPILGMTIVSGDCPFEMGLRYMIDFNKEDYKFFRAINEHVLEPKGALIAFNLSSNPPFQTHKELEFSNYIVTCDALKCGHVRSFFYSPKLSDYYGYAIIQNEFALPGHTQLKANDFSLKTISSPLLNTLSNSVMME